MIVVKNAEIVLHPVQIVKMDNINLDPNVFPVFILVKIV